MGKISRQAKTVNRDPAGRGEGQLDWEGAWAHRAPMPPALSTTGPHVRSAHTCVHRQGISVTVAAPRPHCPGAQRDRAEGVSCVPRVGAGLCVHCAFWWLQKAAL